MFDQVSSETVKAAPFSNQLRLRLSRNVGILAGSQIVGGVLSALVVMLTTRLLGAEGYGSYSLFLLAVSTGGALGINWLFNGIYKVMSDRRTDGRPVGPALLTGVVAVGLSWAMLTALFLFGSFFLEREILGWAGLFLLPGYVLISGLVTIVNYSFQALGDFSRYAILPNIERAFFAAFLGFSFYFQFEFSPVILVSSLFVSQAALLGLALTQLNWRRIRPLQYNVEDRRLIVAFSIPYILTNFLAFASQWWDVTVVERFLSRAELGIFYLASQFQTLSTQAIFVVNTVLVQMFLVLRREGRSDRIRNFYQTRVPKILILSTVGLLLGSQALRFLFPLVFSADFQPAQGMALWLVLPLHAAVLFVLYHPLLFASEKTRQISIATFLAFAVCAPISFFMVPQWGANGAVLARVLSGLILTGTVMWFAAGEETGPGRRICFLFAAGQGILALNAWLFAT